MQKKYKLLIIGGSAGSLEIVFLIIAGLKRLILPVIIILHRREDNDNLLVELLSTRTSYFVKEAEDKELLIAETIYIAPPDYHLLVEKNNSLSLDLSERVNFSRPSIDVCFETAAEAYKGELIAVLLSGANSDGAVGMQKVKSCGGLTIVQDPATAEVAYMPERAILKTRIDHIIPGSQLTAFLNELMGGN